MKKIWFLVLVLLSSACHAQSVGFNISLNLVGQSCSDGIKNQNETGIDCGGPCPSCETCYDGIQNQDEEGVDCGGACEDCPEEDNYYPDPLWVRRRLALDDTCFNHEIVNTGTLLSVDHANLSVYQFGIKLREKMSFYISLCNHEEISPNTTVNYGQFKISADQIAAGDIEEVSIWCRLPISINISDDEEFVLLNYQESWVEVPTELLALDENYYYLLSNSDSIGVFSIVTKKIIPGVEQPEERQQESEIEEEDGQEPEEIIETDHLKIIIFAFLLFSLCLTVFIYLRNRQS